MTVSLDSLETRFDYYQCTIREARNVAEHLGVIFGAEKRPAAGRWGYARGSELVSDETVSATVYTGSARADETHVVISGASCDRVVPVIRNLWPRHAVSRADSALDCFADFDRLDADVLRFARDHGIKYRLVTDSDGGATRYLGAPSSTAMLRVYKKSEQLRSKLTAPAAARVPDGVVRFELQVRPGKAAQKAATATMTADDLWGFTKWGKQFAESFLALDVERAEIAPVTPSTWSKALYWLQQQYGAQIRARAADVGTAALLAELQEAFELDTCPGESVASTPTACAADLMRAV